MYHIITFVFFNVKTSHIFRKRFLFENHYLAKINYENSWKQTLEDLSVKFKTVKTNEYSCKKVCSLRKRQGNYLNEHYFQTYYSINYKNNFTPVIKLSKKKMKR